jgi:hypothetical protein
VVGVRGVDAESLDLLSPAAYIGVPFYWSHRFAWRWPIREACGSPAAVPSSSASRSLLPDEPLRPATFRADTTRLGFGFAGLPVFHLFRTTRADVRSGVPPEEAAVPRHVVAGRRQRTQIRPWTDGRGPRTSYSREIEESFVAELAVSIQITILKVLAGHPDGHASVTELKRYVSTLMSSGSDWTNRMRRLAARAPKLDIFSDAFVLQENNGWRITDTGRQFLASLEAPVPVTEGQQQPSRPGATVPPAPSQVQPALRLVVDNTCMSQSRPGSDETRRSA